MMDTVRALEIPTSRLRGTTGSLRLNRDSPAAIGDLARDGIDVARIARRVGSAVVLANSLRAGLAGVVAERVPGCPPHVVHIHDVLPPGRAAAAINGLVRLGTTRAVANSRYAAEHFAPAGAGVDVVYNPIDLARFDPRGLSPSRARELAGLPAGIPLVGVVAQITPWKAQIDAIRAHRLVRREVPGARLLVGGTAKFVGPGTRFDNSAYLAELRAEAANIEGEDPVFFLGERDDVPRILRALDVLVMPSWEEPFGRIAVEAMAMGTAVVATRVGGPPEYVEHGVSGMLVTPREPATLACEITRLLGDDVLRARIAAAGQEAVRARFDVERYRQRMVQAFERAIRAGPARARPRPAER
jgi:glycosyltransferase involved in cell wall biosynthesis